MHFVDTSPFAREQSSVTLILVPGQSDYASCAGTYTKLSVGEIRDKPVYHNKAASRIIFYTGGGWGITSVGYLTVVMNGATGAFYYSQSSSHAEASQANWLPRYSCT